MSSAFLAGRVIIVTGAGGGLGRGHALELARHGATVIVNDMNEGPAQTVANEIEAASGTALPVAASVTDEAAVKAMVEQVHGRFGRIDGLVNNAGILRDRSFAKMEMEISGWFLKCISSAPPSAQRLFGRSCANSSSDEL